MTLWRANSLTTKAMLLLAAGAVASFHLAYAGPKWCWLILVFMGCLLPLARADSGRKAFYFGLVVGLLIYAPQLLFFWKLFQFGAIALWCVLAFWLALFVVLARGCLLRFGGLGFALAIPFLWTGLEYFRSELYYLKFTWLNIGYAFSFSHDLPVLAEFGVYGIGFCAVAVVINLYLKPTKMRGLGYWAFKFSALLAVLVIALLINLFYPAPATGAKKLRVAGVQMEFPNPAEVVLTLDQVTQKFPQADLLVLSEFTFDGPIPDLVKKWCRAHRKYLIAGGKDPAPGNQFYNTAYVVDTNGTVVFQQVKSVPVQFMKDGLPAKEQKLWDSPWGKIGLGLCYDASYRRVTDELIRQGAQALIFPTMDTEEWGEHEHKLHSRIAPMRAAEFGVPIVRICSSGISQLIAYGGTVVASAPYPGQRWMVSAELTLPAKGHLPLDRLLAPICVLVTALLFIMTAIGGFKPGKPVNSGSPRLNVPLRRM